MFCPISFQFSRRYNDHIYVKTNANYGTTLIFSGTIKKYINSLVFVIICPLISNKIRLPSHEPIRTVKIELNFFEYYCYIISVVEHSQNLLRWKLHVLLFIYLPLDTPTLSGCIEMIYISFLFNLLHGKNLSSKLLTIFKCHIYQSLARGQLELNLSIQGIANLQSYSNAFAMVEMFFLSYQKG